MWWVLDVHYAHDRSVVAGVGVTSLDAAEGEEDVVVVWGAPADYEPGSFYKRELPLLLAFLHGREVTGVVVDGFVWLGPDRPGLGLHLHEALEVPVIGIAKTGFHEADAVAVPVLRGDSAKPLWVTAVGVDDAASVVAGMDGPWRIPTLVKRADRLGRDA
ncbi:MAG: endonuclease V [Alphaproteobacteria bacterium]|nr:endonuclease V [Alphaproteobacteria bacterium]MCB9691523.1 endonuclease V [Alphaproteobacteria bacterium]